MTGHVVPLVLGRLHSPLEDLGEILSSGVASTGLEVPGAGNLSDTSGRCCDLKCDGRHADAPDDVCAEWG